MTELMEQVVKKLRSLSPQRQDELAPAMMMLADEADDVYQLTADEAAAIERSRKAAAQGEFATDEQLSAHRAKYRL